jgi:hypothetical protein
MSTTTDTTRTTTITRQELFPVTNGGVTWKVTNYTDAYTSAGYTSSRLTTITEYTNGTYALRYDTNGRPVRVAPYAVAVALVTTTATFNPGHTNTHYRVDYCLGSGKAGGYGTGRQMSKTFTTQQDALAFVTDTLNRYEFTN